MKKGLVAFSERECQSRGRISHHIRNKNKQSIEGVNIRNRGCRRQHPPSQQRKNLHPGGRGRRLEEHQGKQQRPGRTASLKKQKSPSAVQDKIVDKKGGKRQEDQMDRGKKLEEGKGNGGG